MHYLTGLVTFVIINKCESFYFIIHKSVKFNSRKSVLKRSYVKHDFWIYSETNININYDTVCGNILTGFKKGYHVDLLITE